MRARRVLPLLIVALLASLVVAPSAFADLLTPEDGGSPNADRIDDLYKVLLVLGVIVFLAVEGVLVYTLVRFRARKGDVPAQIRGNTRLEIGWTIGAAVILLVISVVTFAMYGGIREPEDSDAEGFQAASGGVLHATSDKRLPPNGKSLNITVNGQQYLWRYVYPDGDDNTLNNAFAYTEMVVPTGTTVTLDIEAQDVVHSWWIPALGGKMDAVPGHTNHTWFKIPKPGVYRGQCAELCGRNHANMLASVRAVEPAEFEAWLEERKQDIDDADAAAAKSRKRITDDPNAGP